MAEEATPETEASAKSGGSKVATAAALVALTLLAGGAGAGIGLHLFDMVESVAKQREAKKTIDVDPAYTGGMAVKALPPVITSLSGPGNTWVRIEASIVFADGAPSDADTLAARIAEDTLAYLRTVSLRQIEGAAGLLHLREDLNERASIRSEGRVREVVVQTLAVE